MKFVTFAKAPDGRSRSEFQDWFARTHALAIRERAPSYRGGVVRRTQRPPPMPHTEEPPYPMDRGMSYDVLAEMWFPSSEDFRREVLPTEQGLRDLGCRFASYAVTPRLQKDPRCAEAGPNAQRPELTYVLALKWAPAMTAERASKEWDDHSAIALRCQPSISKYEQNLVIETISWTQGASRIDAFADFSFPRVQDFVEGFNVTVEELQDMDGLIGAFDVAFLGDAAPL